MRYKTTTLDTFVTLQRGFDLPAQNRIPGEIPIIAANGPVGFHNLAKVNAECVVLGRSGSVGNPQLITEPFWPLNTTLFVKDFHGNSPTFVYYVLKTIDFKSFDAGGTVPTLNRNHLTQIEVPLLDLAHQESIGGVLRNLDAKIAANNALSKTLEDIAQTIFKSWFIDFDPVKAKMAGEKPAGMDAATAALFADSFEETELGLIPNGWKATKLSFSLKLHKSTIKAGPFTESVPYVPVDQIGAKDIFLKNSMQGSEAKTSLVSFKKNDILFGAMRPYFHKVVLAPFNGTTRTTTFVLRAINPHYLSHSLFTVYQENAVAYATNNSQGTTIPYAVWNNSFEDFPIVLPPEPIAKAFNNLVLSILEFGYSLIAQNRSLVEIRDGLLPRLISGELQIRDEMLAS